MRQCGDESQSHPTGGVVALLDQNQKNGPGGRRRSGGQGRGPRPPRVPGLLGPPVRTPPAPGRADQARPRILALGSGTRLRLLPAKLPARLGGPRVPHAWGSPFCRAASVHRGLGRHVLILSSGQSGADCGVLAAAPHTLPHFGFSPILTVRPRASRSPVLDQCYGVCEILANGQDLNAMASRGHRPTETMFSRRDGPQT